MAQKIIARSYLNDITHLARESFCGENNNLTSFQTVDSDGDYTKIHVTSENNWNTIEAIKPTEAQMKASAKTFFMTSQGII